jgi:4-hydroxy-tetrahydrodipicolinate synthase
MSQKPWRGIHVATALPFHDDLSVDYDGFADHVRWLADNGMDGVAPNGSLGEYHSLTDEERARVVEVAIDGVQASTRYPGDVALRFARVKRYRHDKTASEADTLDSLQGLLRRPNP